jgi:hypothetical protein
VINSEDSNSGMNLLRQRLAPLQRDGQFFAKVGISGAHRESLRWLREERRSGGHRQRDLCLSCAIRTRGGQRIAGGGAQCVQSDVAVYHRRIDYG